MTPLEQHLIDVRKKWFEKLPEFAQRMILNADFDVAIRMAKLQHEAAEAMAEALDEMTEAAEVLANSRGSEWEGDGSEFENAKAALSAYRKETGTTK